MADFSILNPGDSMTFGDRLVSPSGVYWMFVRGTTGVAGTLIVESSGGEVWRATPGFFNVASVVMQPDGNLVLLDTFGGVRWQSNTAGNPGAVAIMRDDGVAEVRKTLWASPGPPP